MNPLDKDEGGSGRVRIERVHLEDMDLFRAMVKAYWQDLMPHADVVRDAQRREAYFQEEFPFDSDSKHLFWAMLGGRHIGFMTLEVNRENKSARVDDFYVVSEQRRRGYGSATVQWMFSHFGGLGAERIDLNVRRDNPDALAFLAGARLWDSRLPPQTV